LVLLKGGNIIYPEVDSGSRPRNDTKKIMILNSIRKVKTIYGCGKETWKWQFCHTD